MHAVKSLQRLIDVLPARFKAIPPEAAADRLDGAWSVKMELGHLIDSAANNHQRIVRAQLEESPSLPGYDGEKWVEAQAYQNREWNEVIALWEALNRHLLAAARAVPQDGWARTCTVAGSEPMTLQFLLADYISHMRGHLEHMKVKSDDLA